MAQDFKAKAHSSDKVKHYLHRAAAEPVMSEETPDASLEHAGIRPEAVRAN